MIRLKSLVRFLPLLFLLMLSSCYSFQGIAIAKEIETYYVAQFDNVSGNVVPTLAPNFTEKLKDKVRNESRLIYLDNQDADVEFSGVISDFRVTSEAPQPGEDVAFNRLTIGIRVEYTNRVKEEESTTIKSSFYAEYPSDTNLLDVQEDLIETITDQLVEDVFTKAFTNW
ncbi:MAG: LPS assembly lipoprotein LptE [Bacteroidota bacterium]